MTRTRKGSVPAGSSPLVSVNPWIYSPPSSPSTSSPGFSTPTSDGNFTALEKAQGFPWYLPSVAARTRAKESKRPSPLKFAELRRPSEEDEEDIKEDEEDDDKDDKDDENADEEIYDTPQMIRMREEIEVLREQVRVLNSQRRVNWDAIIWSGMLSISLGILYFQFA